MEAGGRNRRPRRRIGEAAAQLLVPRGRGRRGAHAGALRMVWEIARQVTVPVIGIGGIQTVDDVMEFLVAGASAVQLGTVNFYDPTASVRIVDQLPAALAELGAESVREVVGSLRA